MDEHYRKELRVLGEIKTQFASRGWMQATSGNFSFCIQRAPLRFFVSVSGRDKSINLPDDFLLVDEKGTPVVPTSLRPSAEAGVHAEIYKKTSSTVVLHIHTLFNTIVSIHSLERDHVVFEGLEMIKGLDIWEEDGSATIPIVPNYHRLPDLASAVGQAIHPEVPGVLIRGHGLYAWGNSLHEAKRNVEAFEFLFSYRFLESQINQSRGRKQGKF